MFRSLLLAVASAIAVQSLTPSTYLTSLDQLRLKELFQTALSGTDLSSTHYAVVGLKTLGLQLPPKELQDACNLAKKVDATSSMETLYYAASISKLLGKCQLSVANAQKLLEGNVKEGTSIQDLYYITHTINNLGLKLDSTKMSAALTGALKNDDSIQSLGYSFHVAAELSGNIDAIFDRVEDAVVQADEIDQKYLQFEGGVSVTALVVDGIFKIAAKKNQMPAMKAEQAVLFVNYLLSRKHVQLIRAAANLVTALKTLSTNKFLVPVAVTLASPLAVDHQQPNVQVRVTSVLGDSLGALTITADSATRIGDNIVIFNKKPFSPMSNDKTLYEFNLADSKPSPGFYKIALTLTPQKKDDKLIALKGAQVEVKVIAEVNVPHVEIAVADKEQAGDLKFTKVGYQTKMPGPALEADSHQKVVMKFSLKNKADGTAMTAHQVFVRFTQLQTKQEITFVAEPSDNKNAYYKFEMDVGSHSKEFGHASGRYSVDLVVGDAVISNPFQWSVADINLDFPGAASKQGNKPESTGGKKPEITHMFREAEKRPPGMVSKAFAAAVLLPILVLFVVWIRIGANISNFPLSLSAVGFHLGIAAIFCLYYCFWTQLNMFTTLWYLSLLGLFTFLCGHRLLRSHSEKSL